MKVILSRKGFDSKAGGKASPIFNSKFISIPIPQAGTNVFYKDLVFNTENYYLKTMKDLGINYFSEAHLDPDLRRSSFKVRPENWTPVFGQDDVS